MIKFSLNKKEESLADEFKKKHLKTCKKLTPNGYPIGPLFTFSFTPTGIGVETKIKCLECGEVKDITDIDCW